MTEKADDLRRHYAESLWEELGGDRCVCQQPDVMHWCESCQRKVQTIMEAFRKVLGLGEAVVPATGRKGIAR